MSMGQGAVPFERSPTLNTARIKSFIDFVGGCFYMIPWRRYIERQSAVIIFPLQALGPLCSFRSNLSNILLLHRPDSFAFDIYSETFEAEPL